MGKKNDCTFSIWTARIWTMAIPIGDEFSIIERRRFSAQREGGTIGLAQKVF